MNKIMKRKIKIIFNSSRMCIENWTISGSWQATPDLNIQKTFKKGKIKKSNLKISGVRKFDISVRINQ